MTPEPAEEYPSLQEMLELVAVAIAQTSQRSVARTLGMSTSGVMKLFAPGRRPTRQTMHKLRAFFFTHSKSVSRELRIEFAIGVLTRGLRPDLVEEWRRRIRDIVDHPSGDLVVVPSVVAPPPPELAKVSPDPSPPDPRSSLTELLRSAIVEGMSPRAEVLVREVLGKLEGEK